MQTYRSKETVKARKVTDSEGEYVVTSLGTYLAREGDYVVSTKDGHTFVMEAENFESQYEQRQAAKKTASQASSKTGKSQSAAARVKSAQKRS